MERVDPLMQEIADKFGLRIRFGRFAIPVGCSLDEAVQTVEAAEEEYARRKV